MGLEAFQVKDRALLGGLPNNYGIPREYIFEVAVISALDGCKFVKIKLSELSMKKSFESILFYI